VTHYWVDTWTFIKNSKKSRSDTWHATVLTCVHLKKIKNKNKKNSKKLQSDT